MRLVPGKYSFCAFTILSLQASFKVAVLMTLTSMLHIHGDDEWYYYTVIKCVNVKKSELEDEQFVI